MNVQSDRLVNLSLRLIDEHKGDRVFMELYALHCMIKLQRRDSRIRFKNQKHMLGLLGIGHSKMKQLMAHPMFDELFRLGDNFIIAKRYKVNGVCLTLGVGKYKAPKNRIIIKVRKKEIYNYEKILDRIREAMFANLVRNNESVLYSGETDSREKAYAGSCSYAGLIDSTISVETIAGYLSVKTTKAKEIADMTVCDKIVKKLENKHLVWSCENPYEYVAANEHNYPIGKLLVYGHCVYWQIPNSWALCKKGLKNRWYFGERDLKKKEAKRVPRKNDFDFFKFNNTRAVNFLDVKLVSTTDGEIIGIQREENAVTGDDVRGAAKRMAMEAHKEFWDGYEASTKNKIIRKYKRAIMAEKRMARKGAYMYHLEKSHKAVLLWTEERRATAEAALQGAEVSCEEVGITVESACGKVYRKMKWYNSHLSEVGAQEPATFNEVRDLLAEIEGDKAKGIGSISEDVYRLIESRKFVKMRAEWIEENSFSEEERKRYEDDSIPAWLMPVNTGCVVDEESGCIITDIPYEEDGFAWNNDRMAEMFENDGKSGYNDSVGGNGMDNVSYSNVGNSNGKNDILCNSNVMMGIDADAYGCGYNGMDNDMHNYNEYLYNEDNAYIEDIQVDGNHYYNTMSNTMDNAIDNGYVMGNTSPSYPY